MIYIFMIITYEFYLMNYYLMNYYLWIIMNITYEFHFRISKEVSHAVKEER